MAQARVTNFFNSKKRNADIQPSKRRKVQKTIQSESTTQVLTDESNFVEPAMSKVHIKGPSVVSTRTRAICKQTTAKGRSTRSRKREETFEKLQDIRDLLTVPLSSSNSKELNMSQATEACDDHQVSPPTTPSKRVKGKNVETPTVPQKRNRATRGTRRDLFQVQEEATKGFDFTDFIGKEFKKSDNRVILKGRSSLEQGELKEVVKEESKDVISVAETQASKSQNNGGGTKKKVEVSEEAEPGQTSKSGPQEVKNLPEPKAKPIEARVKSIAASKDGVAEMRAKLSKVGKLAELQEKLAQFSKANAKQKGKQPVATKTKALDAGERGKDTKKEDSGVKAPAYERFHSLASPIPPSLSLPYKYRVLADMFTSTETVVSMLHKRSEMCTFSKLRNGVQQMMHKAFEERNLAQIKGVFPRSYTLRQEKGLMCMGMKKAGYELTVEANLKDDLAGFVADEELGKEQQFDKCGRPVFSANRLLQRKAIFQRMLIHITKQYHREYLAKLDRPLLVSDDKLTRWHPRFKLDEVPDIEPADIPRSPDVKKFSTAAEVLKQATGYINARVQQALESVNSNEMNIQKSSQPNSPAARLHSPSQASGAKPNAPGSSRPNTPVSKPNTPAAKPPAPVSDSLKGVSSSLLERIRAKEAKKEEKFLTRKPEEDKRLQMIGRLPEIVRIVRGFFVTEKKPAVLMDDAALKVADSYRSCLGPVEAMNHVKLMVELLPEWVSVVTIRKGNYLKIDKNKDIGVLQNKLHKLMT